tara:strand:+ start:197 stop:739 length:543 start_codon:yes stop_codon:yes gene_type:complete
MNGWLYLIKNGDLYKIGVTRNFENRMRQLKPDNIVAKLYSSRYKQLEKELHKRYKNVRIPQTEYFRLEQKQINDIKQILSSFYYPKCIRTYILLNLVSWLSFLFIISALFYSLIINDIDYVILRSLLLMERLSFCLSFLSLLINSNKYLSFFNEFKFRSTRFCFLLLFTFLFRIVYKILA